MRWDATRAGFRDELEKISEISLAGLSHESVMRTATPAPPVESNALNKALAILARKDQFEKMAYIIGADLPQYAGLQEATGTKKKRKKNQPKAIRETGSATAHTIGGAGAGRLIGDFAMGHGKVAPHALRKAGWYGTAIGGGVGAATYVGKKLTQRQEEKTAGVFSLGRTPAQSLKISRQTSNITGKTHGRFGGGPTSLSRIARRALPKRTP